MKRIVTLTAAVVALGIAGFVVSRWDGGSLTSANPNSKSAGVMFPAKTGRIDDEHDPARFDSLDEGMRKIAWEALLQDDADPRMKYLVDAKTTLPELFREYSSRAPEEAWKLTLTTTNEDYQRRMISDVRSELFLQAAQAIPTRAAGSPFSSDSLEGPNLTLEAVRELAAQLDLTPEIRAKAEEAFRKVEAAEFQALEDQERLRRSKSDATEDDPFSSR